MRLLTKSRFKLAIECPTKLFYTGKPGIYADRKSDNEFLQMLAEGGHQVGELAKQRFPDGVEVHARNPLEAVSETLRLLEGDRDITLFEPAIRFDRFLVRVDILVRTANQFEIIEVKAKGYDPGDPGFVGANGNLKQKMLPYLQDAAFQAWVLRCAFPQARITTSLMMPNKLKTTTIDGLNQMFKLVKGSRVEVQRPDDLDLSQVAEELLDKICIDEHVERIMTEQLKYPGCVGSFAEVASFFALHYADDLRIAPPIGAQCAACQFRTAPEDTLRSGFHECWKIATGWSDDNFPARTVLDLWNYRNKQALIDDGVFALEDVRPEHLDPLETEPGEGGLTRAQRQWLQVAGIPAELDGGGFYFNRELFAQASTGWRYPLHMIDFETATSPLPFHKGMHPYEPVAFQFSHHSIDEDGRVRHANQFLCAKPGTFPNYEFARALKHALQADNGSVFMWSNHENTILTKIIAQLDQDRAPPDDADDLKAFLASLITGGERQIFDLCALAEKAYFHPATNGSNSLKKVLPACIESSVALRNIYSQPTYGKASGVPSLNDWGREGFRWLSGDRPDTAGDPYARLQELAESMLPEHDHTRAQRASIIAEGGAAATAYARLQAEWMSPEERQQIEAALLRYCELDTLAMAMIMQAWLDFAKPTKGVSDRPAS